MKKVILSVVVMLGLVGSANAVSLSQFLNGAPMPAAFAVFIQAAKSEYKACNDAPYKTVKHASGSNYSFNVSECEIKANPGKYK